MVMVLQNLVESLRVKLLPRRVSGQTYLTAFWQGFALVLRSWGAFKERVDDGEPADPAPVLHVFAVEDVATGFDRRSDDQRIVERDPVIPGQSNRAVVGLQRDGQDVVE